MKAPRYIAHPCRPEAIVYGAELEPGDVLQVGDMFSGVVKLGQVPSDDVVTAGKWLTLMGWLAAKLGGRPALCELTSWVRPMPEPLACQVCVSIREYPGTQCAQHPTRMVP